LALWVFEKHRSDSGSFQDMHQGSIALHACMAERGFSQIYRQCFYPHRQAVGEPSNIKKAPNNEYEQFAEE
jgi:hypothetical protein